MTEKIVFTNYLNQDYEAIKKECLKKKSLFEDSQFPANDTSLYKVNKKSSI